MRVAKESSARYVVPRMQIAAEGLDPDTIFSEQTFRRTHEAVVKAVQAGEADVGATFASFGANATAPTTAGWLEVSIPNEEIHVIATAGPIPSDVIAMSKELAADTAKLLSEALRDLGQPVKLLLGAESFEKPDSAHFDALRKLASAAASHADGARAK
ncbi:MAG: PhnD/SsuA/transferrin family substrate-binding protein [Polyangiaceae bacterium]